MPESPYTRESFLTARSELLQVLAQHGIPGEVGKVIAGNLRSERAIRRMTSYMRIAHPGSMEQIADEMVAIMEDQHRWAAKKQAEESNISYNTWLNSNLRETDD